MRGFISPATASRNLPSRDDAPAVWPSTSFAERLQPVDDDASALLAISRPNRAGFSVRRNRPYVQTGIRTPRRTIRSEHSARTDAQTILVQ